MKKTKVKSYTRKTRNGKTRVKAHTRKIKTKSISRSEYRIMFAQKSQQAQYADVGKTSKNLIKDGEPIEVSANRKLTNITERMDVEGIDDRQDGSRIINKRFYVKGRTYPTKEEAKESASHLRKHEDIDSARVIKTNDGYTVYSHFRTKPKTKPIGYMVKDGRVYYRTPSGKEGSMPKGHVKMVARWKGMKEVEKL